MRVFVLNKNGKALMPCKPRKAKLLLKEGKATVVSRSPFTIKLKCWSNGYNQPITLGVDTAHSTVGISAIISTKELFSIEAKLRNDISEKITTRAMYRRNKRNRLRYRKPRFLNRGRAKGWLAPSVQWKVDAHLRIINKLSKLMPVSKVILETASFDTQKMKNPSIQGIGYQKGVQYGYDNVKAYVLSRDGHKCQSGKTGCSKMLNVHHIKFKSKSGSDAPSNLITLCEKHHDLLHEGKLQLNFKGHKSLKAATTMSIIRVYLLRALPDALETFGYITKVNRQLFKLEKSHVNDAFVIAGGKEQMRCETINLGFKRKNNRCLQKNRKGYAPAIRRERYKIQPKDIIRWEGKDYVSKGTFGKGMYVYLINGTNTFYKSTKNIKVIYHQKSIIIAIAKREIGLQMKQKCF